MKRLVVEAQSREEIGKLNPMKAEGFIPAVVYDQAGNSTPLKIQTNAAIKTVDSISGTPLIDLTVDGKKSHVALLKEIQIDPRNNQVRHLSFMALDPKKKADFEIEIIAKGESPAVKNGIGVLILSRNSLQMRGLPEHVPPFIEANINPLENIGDTIIVSDLNIPKELEFINESVKELDVAAIQPFQKTLEEEDKEAEEARAEELDEVELDEDGEPIEPTEGEEGEGDATEEGEGETEEPAETDEKTE